MKKVIFLTVLASIAVISSLTAAESERPVQPPGQLVIDPAQVPLVGSDPAAWISELTQPEACATSQALGGSWGVSPICITCTTHQQCFFACGGSGSCFPNFGGLCDGPPTRMVCYC